MNTCDKCNMELHSEELVWITAEDFAPWKGEHVSKAMYELFDALCEPCYLSEITILS